MEISCRHLVQKALHRDFPVQFLQGTYQRAESNPASRFLETTLNVNEPHVFTTKVALVLLVCSN